MIRSLLAVSAVALAATAGTAQAAQPQTTAAEPAAGTVSVGFTVQKFVRRGKQLVATGAAVATYQPREGAATVVRQPFTAKVVLPRKWRTLASSQRLCSVLYLQLDKLHLELLGLIVDLDKVTLTVTANSRGGVLGDLFCKLANTRVSLRGLSSASRDLTRMAQQTGLATSGIAFALPLSPAAAAQEGTCEVLDLILGPLDLRLLGLRAHLSQVHLTITANPTGGVLGSLFCSLANTQIGVGTA